MVKAVPATPAPRLARRAAATRKDDAVPERLKLARALRYNDGERFAAGTEIRPRELGMSSETVRWLRQSGTVEA